MLRMIFLLLLLMTVTITQAQDLTCADMAALALDEAVIGCAQLDTGAACYGHGELSAVFSDEQSLDEPRAQASLMTLQTLQTSALNPADENWGLARLRIPANLTGADSVLLVTFGDVLLENAVSRPAGPRIEVVTTRGLNLRDEPSTDARVMGGLVNRQTVTVDARNADSSWLHVSDPPGWVFTEFVDSPEDVSELSVMTDPDMPLQTALQVFNIRSGTGMDQCPQFNHNGLLIQSPLESSPAHLTINGADFNINGTLYLQAFGNLFVQMLEGSASVAAADDNQYLIAGTQVSIPLNASGMIAAGPGDLEAYDEEGIATLPLVLLDREFELVAALTAEELAALEACTITAPANVNLRDGPGTVFALQGSLEAQGTASVRGRVVGTDQFVWWQLADGTWVRSDVVVADENCSTVPVVEETPEPPDIPVVSRPPDVIYRMETCSLVMGELADGQVIGFALGGGSWTTRAEARQVIPELSGTITIDGASLGTTITTLQWGEDNYGVNIQGNWTAVAGTYNVSARLTLFGELFADCTVTVG